MSTVVLLHTVKAEKGLDTVATYAYHLDPVDKQKIIDQVRAHSGGNIAETDAVVVTVKVEVKRYKS